MPHILGLKPPNLLVSVVGSGTSFSSFSFSGSPLPWRERNVISPPFPHKLKKGHFPDAFSGNVSQERTINSSMSFFPPIHSSNLCEPHRAYVGRYILAHW